MREKAFIIYLYIYYFVYLSLLFLWSELGLIIDIYCERLRLVARVDCVVANAGQRDEGGRGRRYVL